MMLASIFLLALFAIFGPTFRLQAKARPNLIFFLTDDQDLHLDSLSYQPLVRKYLIDEGLTFHHHYCTVALCCPSRVNLWTGLAAHNTNVTDVAPPYGGIEPNCTGCDSLLTSTTTQVVIPNS